MNLTNTIRNATAVMFCGIIFLFTLNAQAEIYPLIVQNSTILNLTYQNGSLSDLATMDAALATRSGSDTSSQNNILTSMKPASKIDAKINSDVFAKTSTIKYQLFYYSDTDQHIDTDGNTTNQGIDDTKYYTFIGNGSWFTPSNWQNNLMPPAVLQGREHIIINGDGYCMFSNKDFFIIPEGSSIEIKPGNVFYISIGNNLVLKGGTFINHGTVKVLSGVLNTENIDTSIGDFQKMIFSKSEPDKSDSTHSPDKIFMKLNK